MSNSDNRLYLYENTIELVMTTDQFYVDNRPMNNRKLKAHKGLTNEIIFNIRDRDRKLQNVFPDTLTAYIIHPTTRRRIVSKRVEKTIDVGKVKLFLTAADLETLAPGLYTIYLTRSCNENTSHPIYTDQDNNIKFDIEVTDQLGLEPVVTQEQTNDEFLRVSSVALGDSSNVFTTSALYGNLERNFSNAQHTMAMYLSSFTGNITIQGSCITSVPPSDNASKEWFNIEEFSVTDANVSVVTKTFVVNCNWVRVLSEPSTGEVAKVLLRN